MRIDMFLKVSRIIKQRTQAKEACEAGAVSINGKIVKSSKQVAVNDIIEIKFTHKFIKFRVKEIPKNKNVSKAYARELIEILEEREIDLIDG